MLLLIMVTMDGLRTAVRRLPALAIIARCVWVRYRNCTHAQWKYG